MHLVTPRIWILVRDNALRGTVYAILTVLLLSVSWSLVTTLRAPPATLSSLQSAPPVGARRGARNVDPEGVADHHLFGMAPAAVSVAPVMAAAGIRVIGILADEDSKQSWAILDMAGDQKMYQAGAELPDGEKLLAVKPDRVILSGRGDPYSVMWDMQLANANAMFPILGVSVTDNFDSPPAPAAGSVPHTSTQEALSALRAQLLSKPRLSLPPRDRKPPP